MGPTTPPTRGHPGYVHGGWVALTFDEILGMANIASGHPAHDRHAEDPLPASDARCTGEWISKGWTDRVEGRRIVAKGRMTVDGEITAEAEGLFVTIDPELAAEVLRSGDR